MTETTTPEPRTRLDINRVYYVPGPGEAPLLRSLSDLKGFFIGHGIQYNELPDNTGLIVYESKDHFVYYDARGQIVKNRFMGNTGSIGDKGTNQDYEYDAQGRLIHMKQTILPVQGDEILMVEHRYEYPEGQPADHYIRRTINNKGEKSESTYASRVAEQEAGPQF